MEFIENKIYTIEEIKKIVTDLINEYYPGVKKVILFGSYARGDAKSQSDIDLMVEGNDTFKGIKSIGLMSEIKERSGKFVDLFLERNINKESNFYKNIIKDGVTLYE